MNGEQKRILELLSDGLGSGGSILSIANRIREEYGSGHYPNIYNAIKELEDRGEIKVEKQGRSSLISMNFENPSAIYLLSEMEDIKCSGLKLKEGMLAGILDIGIKFGLGSICSFQTERHIKINRLELLILANNPTAQLIGALYGIGTRYNIKIDPLIMTMAEFEQIIKSGDLCQIKDMISDKMILYNPECFWRTIAARGISGGFGLLGKPPSGISRNALAYNYNRYGYSLYEDIKAADKIAIEDIIFAMSASKEARIRYGALILIHKNADRIRWGYLYYLYKRYEALGDLTGMLASLDTENMPRADRIEPYIGSIKSATPTHYDKRIVEKYLKLYG